MLFKLIGVYFLIWIYPYSCESACTWPAEFRSSTWIDGFKDDLVFGETDMTGWDVKVGNLVINNWECYKTDAFDSDGFLELKTTDTFTMFSATTLYGYLCLKLTKVTDASYRYYLYVRKQTNTQIESSERVFPQEETTIVETSCDESTAATGSEYHVMIKSGQEQAASIECPNVFLGQYSYTFTAGPSICDTTDSNWDTCSDTSVMSFDKCSKDVAYTDLGSLICVDSVPVGTDHLVTVYNSGTVDNTNTFLFSCFAISYDGTQASITPRTCKENQTPAEIPIASNGVPDGSTITLVENGATCPELPGISGGSLLYLTDGAVTYAVYTCNSEYDLYGAQRRTCLADHTWDLEAPLCKCKAPATPDNGNVTVSNDGNTATYTCHAGYIMKGLDTRTCQPTNAWDGVEPTCESCDPINPPQNGTYVFVQEGSVNKVDFSCDVGTTLTGSNTSTCLSDGTWDQEPPSCVICGSINFSSSGNISMATDGMVSTVTFSCMTGYTLTGDVSLTCDRDGNWEGLLPTCECSTPDNPANGNVSGNGLVASYTCHAGYNIVGESSRYCQDGGLGWNGTAPTCEQCTTPTQSTGSNAYISTDGQTSSVQFTCAPGYTLKGNSSATCGQDLQWDAVQPDCVTCENRTVISSGNVTITTDGLVTMATFSCADGYSLTGDAAQTCDTDGVWSSEQPTCECIIPGTLSNGEIKPSSDKSTLYYYCDIGFSLSTTIFIRTCMTNGTGWSGEEPICRHIKLILTVLLVVLFDVPVITEEECSEVSDPDGGNATLETDQIVTSVTYYCDVGYSLNGTKNIECTTEGLWETTEPTCSKCTDIGSSSGRGHTIQTDGSETTATFTCELGYTLSGTSVISCDQNGDWKTSFPTCSKCPDQTAPLSGDVKVTTDGQTTRAHFTCKDDYYLEGLNDFECRPEGIWRAPNPVCKCIPPNSPGNGAITLLNNDETAIYTCDTNFTLKGLAERHCGDNGTGWSGTQPECVTCEAIPNIPGGTLNFTTTGTVTQATYTCPNGSTINGDSVLSCGSDGTWGVVSFPKCETCPVLSSPLSGSVAVDTDGIQTKATFTCLAGFSIDGENTLTCLKNGSWDFVEPTCICVPPAKPDFGSTSISEDKLTVTYTCETGYTLNGDAARSCLHGGPGWNGSDPSCVTCQELSTPSGGNFSLTSTGTETIAKYSCDLGATLKGEPQSSCFSNGSWEVNVPTCESCESLPEPANGNVTLTTDGVTTIATYTCSPGYEVTSFSVTSCQTTGLWEQTDIDCYCTPPDLPPHGNFTLSADRTTVIFFCEEGFTLNGVDSRTCQTGGLGWTDTSPTCTSCDTLPPLEGGNITWSTNGTFTVAKMSCDQGYTIKGVTETTCQTDGSWDYISIPECVSCPVIDPPASGNVSISTNGSVSTALFLCASGYDLVGERSLTCGVDGQWNNNFPTCVCTAPSNISNGNIFVNSTKVVYSCDVGYSIDGNAVRSCLEDGFGWSGSDPSCVGCDPLNISDSGYANQSSDGSSTTAQFGCDVGASLDGETTLTCLGDGVWDTAMPVCVMCPNISKPQNSEQTVKSNGSVTVSTVTCAVGYDVVGDAESYCKTDGTWSSTEPTCICKEGDVPPPINGNRTISADGQVTTYTCENGYTLKGNVERICKNDSTGWSGTSPICVSCHDLPDPANGSVVVTTDGSSTTAEYICDVGSSLKGSQYLTCLDTEEWSSVPSSCVLCPAILPLASGSGDVTTVTNGTTSKAIYNCTDRYQIVGSPIRTCLEDGFWDQSEPRCTCDPPSMPENGYLEIQNEGLVDKAIYTCKTNFTLNGTAIRKCGANGEYWDGSDPTCAECQSLPALADGKLSFTTTGVETIVSIACDVGTSVSGINKLSCNADGSWNASLPTCTKCKALPASSNGVFNLTTDGATTTATLTCSEGYEVTGTGSVSCQSDGTWRIVAQQTCSPVETEEEENSLIAALIAVSVVSVVIITILSLLLARFVYLHLQRRKFPFGDGSYTKYKANGDTDTHNGMHQQNGRIHNADMYDHPPPNDLIGIPSVPFEKTQAPISHQQHVMERGNTSISPAPWGHQKPLLESKQSPRSSAPSGTEEGTRSPSQTSISQISFASLPPLPSVIRPPSSKTPKIIKTDEGKLNSVKLIHNSSKHLVGKPGKTAKPMQQDESEPRPMTPVNF